MIRKDIIFVAIAVPRERIAREGFFAAISPDFIIISAGFLKGIATRTIQGISLTFSQWVFMTSPLETKKTVSASSSLQPARSAPPLR